MKVIIVVGLTVIGLIVIWLILTKSKEESKKRKYLSMQDFKQEIIKVDKAIQDLTWPGALFKYPFFREIHDKPHLHMSTALQVLESRALTEQQKIITALTMQRLPLKEFIKFSEQVLLLLEESKISSEVFRWAIFPTYDWNTLLVKNYRSRAVKELLNKVLQSQEVNDEIKVLVREEIQTGKARKQVQYLKDIGQIH